MNSKTENIEIMINDKADKVIEEVFQSLLSRYQIGLEATVKSSNLSLIMLIYCIKNFIT